MIQFLTTESGNVASLLVTFLPMILIIVFMYLILWLPQRKQDKKDAAMRASIEVGDTVVTIGGVVGRVAAINEKDDTFVLETTSDRVKIRFRRSAISSVEKLDLGNASKDSAAKKDTPAKKN
ncbi:MAG: preprotein translocase subunit YajC [Gemmiger sp.]|uniref:preprotein translocase subunit YajC n=1 Tax=Gemmiger sp. TaxID=2049027 RepID=UPI002A91C6B2|nr:preprotein translocase subunit YajC [Gemmiger sp.]MDY5326148.1 preprotein translocase subunit YajC [Gemmiger sp.]